MFVVRRLVLCRFSREGKDSRGGLVIERFFVSCFGGAIRRLDFFAEGFRVNRERSRLSRSYKNVLKMKDKKNLLVFRGGRGRGKRVKSFYRYLGYEGFGVRLSVFF